MIRLSDTEITNLIAEVKPLPENYKSVIRLKHKKGHSERDFDVLGVDGHDFRVILRQSHANILDFSAILAYRPIRSSELFILRRYNGRSHEHTNSIEGNTFYGFHIHQATERYQELGSQPESYAEPSDNYDSIDKAIERMFTECSFIIPPQIPSNQGTLL